MSSLIASSERVKSDLLFLISQLKAPFSLRLFGNDFQPTSDSLLTDFVEGPFVGYSRQPLAGQFNPPIKVETGFYASISHEFSFTFAAPTDADVFGWWISDDTTWVYAGRFGAVKNANPILPIKFVLTLQCRSEQVS